jgi:serine/threonine protein kinase/Tfp pilus assembly protein PilF
MPPDTDLHTVSAAEDPRVAAVLQEYLTLLEAGARPDRAALLARHPDLAPTLAEAMDGLDFLYGAVNSRPRPAVEPFPTPDGRPAPALLGDFRIVREVGRGGMGVVYEAEQVSLGRRVALKVLPFASALDARHLQRFKNEAQAAAHLHHTNIVPVFAVGSDRGVHYYAMQYIDGQTLADLIRDLRRTRAEADHTHTAATPASDGPATGTNLPPMSGSPAAASTRPKAALTTSLPRRGPAYYKALARLGVQAAEALEYAHQMGVVHRDIKPANLLIDARGALWVTDFGLAQFHGGAELTVSGDVLGTVRYMSPEQAEGRRGLDHRTDIYSLGVSLYELFTFHYPYPAQDRAGLLRQILGEEPRPPRRVRRGLPAELETIALKALAKEPSERYATAQELADDLKRFIEDQPILARRASVRQRIGKWARRHSGMVWMGAALAVLGVVGLSAATVITWRALAQKRESLGLTRKILDELYELATSGFPQESPRLLPKQKEFLLRARDYYQKVADEQGGDPTFDLERARAAVRMGDIENKLGNLPAADKAYEQAMALLAPLAPRDAEARRQLSSAHNSRGVLLIRRGQPVEAEAAFRRAVALQEQLLRELPDDPKVGFDLVAQTDNLGAALHTQGRYEDARQTYATALETANTLLNKTPRPSDDILERKASVLYNLGAATFHLNRHDEARRHWDESLAITRALAEKRPYEPQYEVELASHSFAVGAMNYDDGHMEEAERLARAARSRFAKLVGQYANIPHYQTAYAQALRLQARALRDLNRPTEAEAAYREGLGLMERLIRQVPEWAAARQELLSTRLDLANVLMDMGRADAAVALCRDALKDARDGANQLPASPERDFHLMMVKNNLAEYYRRLGRRGEAEAMYREAVEDGRRLTDGDPTKGDYRAKLAGVYRNLGFMHIQAGQPAAAVEPYRAALAEFERLAADLPRQPRWPVSAAWVRTWLADLYTALDRADDAAEPCRAASAAVRDCIRSHDQDAKARVLAAWFLAANPRPECRDPAEASRLAESVAGQESPLAYEANRALGLARYRQGNAAGAVMALLKARKLRRGSDLETELALAMAQFRGGDPDGARLTYREAIRRIDQARESLPDLDHIRAEADALFRAGP